jgi:hypothetical protein
MEDTAFVGLGFSIDRNAEKGANVVLGCSHIYSSRGEGLQYRLSKIENPMIRGKNPFMSRDDARRTGETIRQLFFDARMKLPRRVVLHKRTPFLKDEREGLLDGLGTVAAIDMLEIQEDHALRYVASKPNHDGTIDEDNYPVRRGTVMKLDDFTALLWVHESELQVLSGQAAHSHAAYAPPPCRGHAARPALRGDSRSFQDELEHLRFVHQVSGDSRFIRRDCPNRIATPAVRCVILRLSALHLGCENGAMHAGTVFRSPRVSRSRARNHHPRRCSGGPTLRHTSDRTRRWHDPDSYAPRHLPGAGASFFLRYSHSHAQQCRRGLIDGTEKHLGAWVWALPSGGILTSGRCKSNG